MSGTPGRLLSLLSLLQSRRDWPGHALAERLGVSPRTVRRDVDRLRELGYPVRATMGPDGGYRLEAGADLPPLLFDDEQAVALAIALQTATASGAGISEAAWRALMTVRQVLPARLRHRLDAVEVSALPHGGAGSEDATTAPEVDPGVLLAVSAAAREHRVLRFDHTSAVLGRPPGAAQQGAPASRPPRRVEPHHVLTRAGRWYLLCWDLERSAWRTYRLDRMTPRTPTGPRFTPREVPGGDPDAFVSAVFRGATDPGRTGTWPCRGEVVLLAPAEAVAPYAEDATVVALDPQRCRVHAGSWSWNGLAARLLRFDADIEAAAPPELARAFTDLAARCAAAAGT